jgi:PilZ domain
MSATNRAIAVEPLLTRPQACLPPSANMSTARGPQPVPSPNRTDIPVLRVKPLLTDTQTRRFARVPTHAVGVHPEHREYPRATLRLPLRLRCVGSIPENFPITLVTRDISSTGVYFLCPKPVALGARIELEIVLVSRPLGRGNVVVTSMARVQRVEPAAMPGWFGVAAAFDEVTFDRDDRIPSRFLNS